MRIFSERRRRPKRDDHYVRIDVSTQNHDEKESLPVLNTLTAVLGFLPIVSAGLYLFGRAKQEGYLQKLGFSPELFPIGFEDALVSGFVTLWAAGIPIAVNALLAAEISVFTVFIMGLVLSARRLSESLSRVRLGATHRRPAEESPQLKKLQVVVWSALALSGAIFVVFLGTALLLKSAVHAGESSAEKTLKNIQDDKMEWVDIQLSEESTTVKGIIVRCNDRYCGYLTAEGAFVVRAASVSSVRHLYAASQGAPPKAGATESDKQTTPARSPQS